MSIKTIFMYNFNKQQDPFKNKKCNFINKYYIGLKMRLIFVK